MSYFKLAESILQKCLEVYDLDMIYAIESMIQKEIENKCGECKQKFNFLPKTIKDLSSEISFDDNVKKHYDDLLECGLFFVIYPQLIGDWETDKQEFYELDSNSRR